MTDVPVPAARQVRASLAFRAIQPSHLALGVAANLASAVSADEHLTIADADDAPVAASEVGGPDGRLHLIAIEPGPFTVEYRAEVVPTVAIGSLPPDNDLDVATIVALRQSRYCPSDELEGFARATFREASPSERARSIAEWIYVRIAYEPGSSGPTDTAIDTLLRHRGVCRDFAHLAIALCRASGIPARMVAAYAPGLDPMDFHAVVEVRTEFGWEVLDPTRLAPRQCLVRISTGRDAADIAFATTISGDIALDSAEVVAVVDGDLPVDDHLQVVHLG